MSNIEERVKKIILEQLGVDEAEVIHNFMVGNTTVS